MIFVNIKVMLVGALMMCVNVLTMLVDVWYVCDVRMISVDV